MIKSANEGRELVDVNKLKRRKYCSTPSAIYGGKIVNALTSGLLIHGKLSEAALRYPLSSGKLRQACRYQRSLVA
jgi:hypothetical protein